MIIPGESRFGQRSQPQHLNYLIDIAIDMNYLVPSNDHFRFKSREWLCCFLDLKPPFNVCEDLTPPSLNSTPQRSLHATSTTESVVLKLLDRLFHTRVPSTKAGQLMRALSDAVVCKKFRSCRGRPPQLYEAWCDKLWIQYLLVNRLPRDYGRRPSKLTGSEWENALSDLLADSDSFSESAYFSDISQDACEKKRKNKRKRRAKRKRTT